MSPLRLPSLRARVAATVVATLGIALASGLLRPAPVGAQARRPSLADIARPRTASPSPPASPTTAAEAQALAERAAARITALQQEAARLSRQRETALDELRALEVERALRAEQLAKAEADLAAATAGLAEVESAAGRLVAVRAQQAPALEARLVSLYKRGPHGYAPLLLGASAQDLARATRALASLSRVEALPVSSRRRTLRDERDVRGRLADAQRTAAARRTEAAAARTAAEVAAARRQRLVDDLGQRRALATAYISELDRVRRQLHATVSGLGPATVPVDLPLRPFRGAITWPATGSVLSRFGRSSGAFGTSVVRNGIEIAVPSGTRVQAVHGGTVAYAAPFTGFGVLVIVDHGASSYSLYGALSATSLQTGATVRRGDLIGTSGRTVTGEPALYFELRVDGRPVDPLEWLQSAR